MSDHSKIEWTETTWNFLSGCTRISDGCTNCYIERTPPFRMAHRKFDKPGAGGKTDIIVHADRLMLPMSWRKPRRVFVNSLADVFHEDVPDEIIVSAFATMALTPQHTYQLLTKRHARMRSLLNQDTFRNRVMTIAGSLAETDGVWAGTDLNIWPLRNVWAGVSVESQQWADIRIPALMDTPAAVRWLSCEPLLGPVDLGIGDPHRGHAHDDVWGHPHPDMCLTCSTDENEVAYFRRESGTSGIDWVVCGGESGPGARPMHPDWARSLRDECEQAGVSYFFKQHGEYEPTDERGIGNVSSFDPRNRLVGEPDETGHRAIVRRVGKKAAGRELDGRTHDDYPTPHLVNA